MAVAVGSGVQLASAVAVFTAAGVALGVAGTGAERNPQAVRPRTASAQINVRFMPGIIIAAMRPPRWLMILVICLTVGVLGVWLFATPPGLYGKLWAVGYSVCHQAPARSFTMGAFAEPLCARCTGTFLAAFLGSVYLLLRRGKRGEVPPWPVGAVLILLAALWAFDGANSFAHIIPGFPTLYTSSNWLRLASGTGLGLGVASVVVPVFHQSLWMDFIPQPALSRWSDLLGMLGLGLAGALAAVSGIPWLAAPMALLSILGVLLLLTLVYTVVWVFLSKTENKYLTYMDIWIPLLAGFTTALVQISAVSLLRYWLTGTWDGFNLPG